jgi:hypothetical protein
LGAWHFLSRFSEHPRVSSSHSYEVEALNELISKINETILANTANDSVAVSSERATVELDVQVRSGAWAVAPIRGAYSIASVSNVTNVLIRVCPPGLNGPEESGELSPARPALLVSAHTDSVFTSFGATDDGASAVILASVAAHLGRTALPFSGYTSPVCVVVALVGAEEQGLFGSAALVASGHPWVSAVRAFANWEGMGKGGRPFTFQASAGALHLAQEYGSLASSPRGSAVGQDVYLSGLVPSDTDYSVYRELGGWKGLDTAYVRDGYAYHTHLDSMVDFPVGSVRVLWDNVAPLLQEVLERGDDFLPQPRNQSEPLIKPDGDAQPLSSVPVFYDVLGLGWATYSKSAATIGGSAVLGILGIFALWQMSTFCARTPGSSWRSCLSGIVLPLSLALATWLVPLLAVIVYSLGIRAMAPLSFYATPAFAILLYGAPALTVVALVNAATAAAAPTEATTTSVRSYPDFYSSIGPASIDVVDDLSLTEDDDDGIGPDEGDEDALFASPKGTARGGLRQGHVYHYGRFRTLLLAQLALWSAMLVALLASNAGSAYLPFFVITCIPAALALAELLALLARYWKRRSPMQTTPALMACFGVEPAGSDIVVPTVAAGMAFPSMLLSAMALSLLNIFIPIIGRSPIPGDPLVAAIVTLWVVALSVFPCLSLQLYHGAAGMYLRIASVLAVASLTALIISPMLSPFSETRPLRAGVVHVYNDTGSFSDPDGPAVFDSSVVISFLPADWPHDVLSNFSGRLEPAMSDCRRLEDVAPPKVKVPELLVLAPVAVEDNVTVVNVSVTTVSASSWMLRLRPSPLDRWAVSSISLHGLGDGVHTVKGEHVLRPTTDGWIDLRHQLGSQEWGKDTTILVEIRIVPRTADMPLVVDDSRSCTWVPRSSNNPPCVGAVSRLPTEPTDPAASLSLRFDTMLTTLFVGEDTFDNVSAPFISAVQTLPKYTTLTQDMKVMTQRWNSQTWSGEKLALSV